MRFFSYMLVSLSTISLVSCGSPAPKSAHICPDWSSNPIHNYQNADFSNFGCAYYNNIAVQVENPDDLQKGHGQNIGEGDRESVNVQKYNTAVVQQAPSVSSTSAAR